jgi:hypothetical protein
MDFPAFQQAIAQDAQLTADEKKKILTELTEEELRKRLAFGVTGAGIGLLLANFLRLSSISRLILGATGYGIGRLVFNNLIVPHRSAKVLKTTPNIYAVD